jgi:hypothetical protein
MDTKTGLTLISEAMNVKCLMESYIWDVIDRHLHELAGEYRKPLDLHDVQMKATRAFTALEHVYEDLRVKKPWEHDLAEIQRCTIQRLSVEAERWKDDANRQGKLYSDEVTARHNIVKTALESIGVLLAQIMSYDPTAVSAVPVCDFLELRVEDLDALRQMLIDMNEVADIPL